jgi:hypothetical protein
LQPSSSPSHAKFSFEPHEIKPFVFHFRQRPQHSFLLTLLLQFLLYSFDWRTQLSAILIAHAEKANELRANH